MISSSNVLSQNRRPRSCRYGGVFVLFAALFYFLLPSSHLQIMYVTKFAATETRKDKNSSNVVFTSLPCSIGVCSNFIITLMTNFVKLWENT